MGTSAGLNLESTLSDRREEEAACHRHDQLLEALARRGEDPTGAPERESLERGWRALEAARDERRRARATRPARAGELLGHTSTGIEAEVQPRMLYVPTGIVHLLGAPSAFGDARPLVSVTVRWQQQGAVNLYGAAAAGTKRLRVEASVEGYSAREVQTREVDVGDGEATFDLMPAFFADRLAAVSETRRAALYVRVSQFAGANGGEAVELERTSPIWLLARQAACVFMKDPAHDVMRDYSYALGGLVTPNEPSILAFLGSTAGADKEGFFGRQSRSDEDIERQVRLLYGALAGLGWRYVAFITTAPRVDGTFFQRVRLPQETLRLRAGNCLDGALLFASLLEAASLEPALVLMRDHAIVAWRRVAPDARGEWAYLDTTYLGRGDFDRARRAGEELAAVRMRMVEISCDPVHFRRWPLSDLRLRQIFPIE